MATYMNNVSTSPPASLIASAPKSRPQELDQTKMSTSSMTCTTLTLCALAVVILQVIGLSLFVLGFFPVKPALSGASGPESFYPPDRDLSDDQNVTNLHSDQLKKLYQERCQIPPSYDRLILMVVDGLPAEFVLGRNGQPPPKIFVEAMPYTQSLLANGIAVGYHAKAAPPTVTMPRLKAMLSGAIGGFLDVAFNFNTQALLDDNLVGQFLKIGWKMVMLGDETWLKLFPGFFTRHDGVSSFYVKDTVEVDHNVSRHLHDELYRPDWNALILHYLGLDHVGHIGGRSSVLMGSKLKEMDEVIKIIHLSTKQSQENDLRRTLLMVVSDHGMTENGNHGGSSFEETNSLVLFIGLQPKSYDHPLAAHSKIDQVDVAPTLALLFGMPIPKNNVGILVFEAFDPLTDEQKLRALELNSWQLFRLLEAQLPGLSCQSVWRSAGAQLPMMTKCTGTDEKTFCCLLVKAAALHRVWISKRISGFNSKEEYGDAVLAYDDFLKAASQWLSRRATYKPAGLLASGIAAMALSCLLILKLLIWLHQEVYPHQRRLFFDLKYSLSAWHLEEIFVLAIVFILVLSMGSSSMVEEEHYMWHFLTSTFHLVLLRKAIKFTATGTTQRNLSQIFCVITVLISGRILQGWHRGGVNWAHLPDMSKWLEQSGKNYVKSIQVVSWLIVMSLSLYFLLRLRLKRYFLVAIGFSFLIPGVLVLLHIIRYQDNAFVASGYGATLMAQKIYLTVGFLTLGTVFSLPWLMPISCPEISSDQKIRMSSNAVAEYRRKFLVVGFKQFMYLFGLVYTVFWCLVQLVLQQPVNAMPVSLLLVQILATMSYSSNSSLQLKQWVEGISSHSILLSGILMFIITYASPMLALLSTLIYMSVKDTSAPNTYDADIGHLLMKTLGFPCLVPLGLNSVLLVTYTVVLMLMQNHLFVWSVFSPKYVYVCATTACVYIGLSVVSLTAFYGVLVFSLRSRALQPL